MKNEETWYYENGKIMIKTETFNGKDHGLSLGFRENGTLISRTNYSHGELSGLQEKWRVSKFSSLNNGRISIQTNKKNELNGVKVYFDYGVCSITGKDTTNMTSYTVEEFLEMKKK